MSSVDLLAIPKTWTRYCEVCQKPGMQRCMNCKVTYYCGKSHKDLDWKAFHRMVCSEIAYLRGEHPFPIGEDERRLIQKELKAREYKIARKAGEIARELILRDEPQMAYAPVMQAYHFFGKDDTSLDIIASYALLAEVFLGLNNMNLAFDYMLQAAWTMNKHDQVPIRILISVHRIKGLIYLKRNKIKRANESFAEYAYCLAERFGTYDVPMASAFGYIGLTLLALKRSVENSFLLFNKMAFMWLDRLIDWYCSETFKEPTEEAMQDETVRENECLLLEAKLIFQMIDAAIRNVQKTPSFDRFIFKLYSIQTILSIRSGNDAKKEELAKLALHVGTNTRMDDATANEKRKYLVEILGGDYLVLWDKKHKRPWTIATKYLDSVKSLFKEQASVQSPPES